jgi:hypothetical protein
LPSPAVHHLGQVDAILLEQIVSVDDLFQASGVHLTKAPSLDATAERFKLGIAKVCRQDLLGEALLVEYTKRLARGQPRDDLVELFVGQDGVELICKARLAEAVGLCIFIRSCSSCHGTRLNLRLSYIMMLMANLQIQMA